MEDENKMDNINYVVDITNHTDNIELLPIEIIIHIMSYLTMSDRICAGLVCRQWYEASITFKFIDKQMISISRKKDNLQSTVNTLLKSYRLYFHFLFKDIEVKRNLPIWEKFGTVMRSLILVSCDLSERTLVNILKCCNNLRILHINACRECLMSGRLLDDDNDVRELSNSFQSLIELSLASNRYLSDALFNRLVSICPNLESLSLADCQISFHSAVYKRFYPDNRSHDRASESLLTFSNIILYIEKQCKKLKHLSFRSTLIDSAALSRLLEMKELKLESLKLTSCVQLTNAGLGCLNHLTTLRVLDLSFCPRVTDISLLCICHNLSNIEILNIRRCRAITNLGMSQITLLKKLKELDISECDQLTGACITQGLCRFDTIEDERKSSELNRTQNKDAMHDKNNILTSVIHNDNTEIFRNNYLEVLSANALNLDEQSIECIANSLSNLKYLDISYCFNAVTDETIQIIFKELTLLKTLKINRCHKVSDVGLTGMGADKRVNIINPHANKSTETVESKLRIRLGSKAEMEIVRDANRKREVTEMCEDPNSPIDYHNISGFSLIRLQGLRILDLGGCNRVTDVTLKYTFTFPELRVLDLSRCQQITDVGLDYLTGNNTAIENLNLSDCHNINDTGIRYVAQRLHRLKRLYIQRCSQLTDHCLDSIKLYAKNLQYLNANSCVGISRAAIESLSYLHVQYSDDKDKICTQDLPLPPFT